VTNTTINVEQVFMNMFNESIQKIKRNDQCAVFYFQILETVSWQGCIRHCNSSVLHST